MRKILICVALCLSATANAYGQDDNARIKEYLGKVLDNIEKIKSASYTLLTEMWQPGDTAATFTNRYFVREFDNPADTTIGSSGIWFSSGDGKTKMEFGYDGNARAVVYNEDKEVVIDNFTFRKLPIRPVNPPFFNYTRSIIRYALTTGDSIDMVLTEHPDHYYFRLTINAGRQVEFFGEAHYMDNSQYVADPTSIYELWINKSDGLPYKHRREMSHSIYIAACENAELNKLSLSDFDMYAHFPEGYRIRQYGDRSNTPPKPSLAGEKAPDWTLSDMDGNAVSLADYKSKVLLIQFTGIGCGPCLISIPFLLDLKKELGTEDFDIAAIETWTRRPHSLKVYSDKHSLTYKLLSATDDVVEAYRTDGAAPVFFILDSGRTVRKVIRGYGESTGGEIRKAIKELGL